MSQVADQTKAKMRQAVDHLKEELKKIRTGRANPAMVESVMVEVYGSPMRLKEVATITSPEARQLLITPFDGKNAAVISKAIEKANLGLQPVAEGNTVRIKIAQMDASQRQGYVKTCHQEKEKAKISVRNIRRDANELIKALKASGEIPEDQFKKLEKSIQELTDTFCKEADDITKAKEDEVMHI
jgi:ribosome recycling factor